MRDKYIYPAVFDYADDGISVSFPDLPGCLSCGDDEEEAFQMAKDVLGGWMLWLEESDDCIPPATSLKDIPTADNERAILIEVWMPLVRGAAALKSVKKTLTIPKWLNDRAMEEGINFSGVLRDGLMQKLNVR